MKAKEFKELIKESVREVIKEEIADILYEGLNSMRQGHNPKINEHAVTSHVGNRTSYNQQYKKEEISQGYSPMADFKAPDKPKIVSTSKSNSIGSILQETARNMTADDWDDVNVDLRGVQSGIGTAPTTSPTQQENTFSNLESSEFLDRVHGILERVNAK
jgi:hypothetical protein